MTEHATKEPAPAPAAAPSQPPQPPVVLDHKPLADAVSKLADAHAKSAELMHSAMTGEKEVVRDPKTGKAVGVRTKVKSNQLGKALKETT